MNSKYPTFSQALLYLVIFSAVGPLMFLCGVALGGDPLDGFAGGPTYNSSVESFLINYGAIISLVAAGISLIATIALAIAMSPVNRQRYLFLPVISFFLSCLYTGIMWAATSYASDRSYDLYLEENTYSTTDDSY